MIHATYPRAADYDRPTRTLLAAHVSGSVQRCRHRIANGTYETPFKLAIAVEKLHDHLTAIMSADEATATADTLPLRIARDTPAAMVEAGEDANPRVVFGEPADADPVQPPDPRRPDAPRCPVPPTEREQAGWDQRNVGERFDGLE